MIETWNDVYPILEQFYYYCWAGEENNFVRDITQNKAIGPTNLESEAVRPFFQPGPFVVFVDLQKRFCQVGFNTNIGPSWKYVNLETFWFDKDGVFIGFLPTEMLKFFQQSIMIDEQLNWNIKFDNIHRKIRMFFISQIWDNPKEILNAARPNHRLTKLDGVK